MIPQFDFRIFDFSVCFLNLKNTNIGNLHSTPHKRLRCACDISGPARAKELALHKIPPMPVMGRWGLATRCETATSRFTQGELLVLYENVVAGRNYSRQASEEAEQERAAQAAAAATTDHPTAKAKAKAKPKASGRGRNRKLGVDECVEDEGTTFTKMWGGWTFGSEKNTFVSLITRFTGLGWLGASTTMFL